MISYSALALTFPEVPPPLPPLLLLPPPLPPHPEPRVRSRMAAARKANIFCFMVLVLPSLIIFLGRSIQRAGRIAFPGKEIPEGIVPSSGKRLRRRPTSAGKTRLEDYMQYFVWRGKNLEGFPEGAGSPGGR
jgi:hypothetical protein